MSISKDLFVDIFLSVVIFILAMIAYGFLLNVIRNFVARKFGGVFAALTFIGIIHHELSHTLMAFVTGAKVNSVVLFRLKAKNGALGEVKFTPRGFKIIRALQVVFVSAAPMLLGSLSLFCLIRFVNPMFDSWKLALMIYVEVSILLNMSLSKVDIKNIFKHIGWLFIFLYILFFTLGFNIMGLVEKVIL